MTSNGAIAQTVLDLGNGWLQIDSGYSHPGHTAVYLLASSGQAAIYDCAHSAGVNRILAAISHVGLEPGDVSHVVVSHPHLDHCAGAGSLIEKLPNATLLAHDRGIAHLIEPAPLISGARQIYKDSFDGLYGEIKPVPKGRVRAVSEGDTITVGSRTLQMLDTPGHIFSHISVLDKDGDCLLSGDSFGVFTPSSHFDVPEVLRVAAAPTQFSPAEFKQTAMRIAAFKPAMILAAHFGKMEGDIDLLAKEICEEVDFFVEIAQKSSAKPDPRRSIEKQLAQLWYPKLNLPTDSDLLGLDIMLNTLGLELWRSKHLERYLAS